MSRRRRPRLPRTASRGSVRPRCPYCGERATKVIDVRETFDREGTWRAHRCEQCGDTFTSVQRIELAARAYYPPKTTKSAEP